MSELNLPKYTHYFSCNFEIQSDLEGATPEEQEALSKEALSMLKTIVATGTPMLEWYDTELTEDVHDL